MGCASSKRVDADAYRPAPASFAVFDINSIKEPWIVVETASYDQKPTHVPAQILEKLNSLEAEPAPPHSWVEVSKALEDLKPTLQPGPKPLPGPEKPGPIQPSPPPPTEKDGKADRRVSFHTLEELDAKLSKSKQQTELRKAASMKIESGTEFRPSPAATAGTVAGAGVGKGLRENMFIVRDRQEREKEGKLASYEKMMKLKRDPLSEFPEKCPPGGAEAVVVYTTSLRGVRQTYEDCNKVKSILDLQRVVYDERDVSLHGEFLSEVKELLGEEGGVPRVFVKGRFIGGAKEVADLDDAGRLGRILTHAGVERGIGRQACGGCGGARFVPCLECGGSCRVMVNGDKERCPKCNENGLVLCPACL
ncbi:hypothetical protein TIFTF001_003293 [Ficus carica]|uniref:Glutaredoxin domain-containing protein n=1 Tax=Ficus carica TaxID=3494 RepID=A0AA88DA08_FICCA|nr:hypothetical protein TIFTF001_003293 [Ficus carica]